MSRRLRIGDAGRKGKGIFAKFTIPAGEVVLSFKFDQKWIWDIPSRLRDYAFQVGCDRYVVPRKNSYARLLNHSCRPNCGFRGATTIVSMREIGKGEELTIDYSTNVGWDGFAMECHCGESNCRGVIRSYGHLSDQQKIAYGSYVSPYLLR